MGFITNKHRKTAKEEAKIERNVQELLLRITHFNVKEIHELKEIYRNLSDYKVGLKKYMSTYRVRQVLRAWFEMADEIISYKIIWLVEPDSKKYVSELGWLKLMSLLLRGTLSEKIDICFKVYDKYQKNALTRDIVEEYVYKTIQTNNQEDAEEIAGEMTGYFFQLFDHERAGMISYDNYRTTVLRLPNLLECFGPVLPTKYNKGVVELVGLKQINIS